MVSNIKDNILQMKNISELMVDLAYSAVFLQDLNITNEVGKMLAKIKSLEEDTTKLLFKIKESDEKRMLLLELIDYIKEISNAAYNIAGLSKSEDIPSIVPEVLKDSDARVIIYTMQKNPRMVKRKVGELRIMSETGARIIAVKRKEKWSFSIDKNTKLLASDFIVAVGPAESEKKLINLLSR